jgi:hypothetical protein
MRANEFDRVKFHVHGKEQLRLLLAEGDFGVWWAPPP